MRGKLTAAVVIAGYAAVAFYVWQAANAPPPPPKPSAVPAPAPSTPPPAQQAQAPVVPPTRAAAAVPASSLQSIEHIVVLYMENRSFDHIFGAFPGANGLANAGAAATQTNEKGEPYAELPPVLDLRKRPAAQYERVPANLPNAPFSLSQWYKPGEMMGSLIHAYYQQRAQINDGKMDRFALHSDAKGYTKAHWDGSGLKMWDWATRYTLMDNFFHGAFGGSFLNHVWLVCACAPVYPDADPRLVAKLGPNGELIEDGYVTPDGFAVNTLEPVGGPFGASTPKTRLLPVQNARTIGDALSEKNVSWSWYSGGWAEAEAGKEKSGSFSYHHQPFAFFANYQRGKAERGHLRDLDDFVADIDKGTLPAVSFYKPRAGVNQHPGNSDVESSDAHTHALLSRLEKSPQWGKMAVIVTYDENGGFWDHVAPPVRDRWGPGARVPTLVVSPFARKGFVDHASYETTSIIKLIETRFGLAPMTDADGKADAMTTPFEFGK